MAEDKDQVQFDREDPAGTKDDAYKAFGKDKRRRITTSQGGERVEYRRKEFTPREEGKDGEQQETRRSYNPNFTADNRPMGERREYGSRDGDRPRYESRNSGSGYQRREEGQGYNRESRYGSGNRDFQRDKPYGEKREYTPRDNGDAPRREYGERRSYNSGERREYTPRDNSSENRTGYDRPRREYGEGRSFDKRPSYGQKREYTPREGGEHSGERREYTPRNNSEGAPRRDYGERRPYGDRTGGERREYKPRDNGEGGQRREYGDRRPYNGGERREYTPRKEFGNGTGAGYRKEGFKPREGGARFGDTGERRPFQKRDNTPRYNSENYPTFPAPPIEDKIRLNRYIAMSGICSRREADEFILSGVVTVNDVVVTEMGAKVSAGDVVKFNDNVLLNEKKVYIVMNKPKGYVTSVEDPHADKTVMELLKNGCRERVYPVGRLDKSSLGVLLITNDGDLAKKLTHPSYEKKKVYQVTLDKPLTRADMDQIVQGITLDDGEIHADAVSYVGDKKNEVGVEIHSGRNRIVRRIFEHLGYRVAKLDRVYFAGLTKQRLKRGEWRFLSPREVQALRTGQYE